MTCPLDVCKTRIISRDRQPDVSPTVPVAALASNDLASNFEVSSPLMSSATDLDGVVTSPEKVQKTIPFADGEWSEGAVQLLSPVKLAQSDDPSSPSGTLVGAVVENSVLVPPVVPKPTNNNIFVELITILKEEGPATLFLGFQQRLLYVGLANGIRLAAYGTSRMDLMMRSLDSI